MKKLALIVALTASSAFAQELTREIPIKDNWTFLVCRQMENGGVTIQRRHLNENSIVKVYATNHTIPNYEIYVDGNLEASCKFLTVKN